MTELDLSESVLDQIMLLSRIWGVTPDEVLRRLLKEFHRGGPPRVASRSGLVEIAVIYEGHRVEALFDPVGGTVEITTGPLANKTYRSPSGAARAVVGLYNPGVSPNRNGWTFWTVTQTDELLETLRRT